MNFGVSPAWFISLLGEGFTESQAGKSLSLLQDLGYTVWQPEIFTEAGLQEWTSGDAESLRLRSSDLGLNATVFVAHFLGTEFSNTEELSKNEWQTTLLKVLDALESWTDIEVVSLPLPQFTDISASEIDAGERNQEIFFHRISGLAEIVESSARVLALEAMPGNLVGGSLNFKLLLEREGMKKVGINYHTGHFHAAGESQKYVLENLGSRITVSHLCDNDGITNLSLPPGDGTILWKDVISGLNQFSYRGSWNVEIRCSAEEVESAYRRGGENLEHYLLKESA